MESIWKQEVLDNKLAEMIAAGLEDCSDLHQALDFLIDLRPIERVYLLMTQVAKLMGMQLPKVRVTVDLDRAVLVRVFPYTILRTQTTLRDLTYPACCLRPPQTQLTKLIG